MNSPRKISFLFLTAFICLTATAEEVDLKDFGKIMQNKIGKTSIVLSAPATLDDIFLGLDMAKDKMSAILIPGTTFSMQAYTHVQVEDDNTGESLDCAFISTKKGTILSNTQNPVVYFIETTDVRYLIGDSGRCEKKAVKAQEVLMVEDGIKAETERLFTDLKEILSDLAGQAQILKTSDNIYYLKAVDVTSPRTAPLKSLQLVIDNRDGTSPSFEIVTEFKEQTFKMPFGIVFLPDVKIETLQGKQAYFTKRAGNNDESSTGLRTVNLQAADFGAN